MGDELTEKMIGAAIEVHRVLGPGFLETIYEQALCVELQLRNVQVQRQVEIEINYKQVRIKGQRIDLLVGGEVIVELKAVTHLPEIATAQALSYLKATGLKRALVINFSERKLVNGVRRISL